MIGPGVVSWRVLQTGREALLLRVEKGRGAGFVGRERTRIWFCGLRKDADLVLWVEKGRGAGFVG